MEPTRPISATSTADAKISTGMKTISFFQVGQAPNRASTTRDQSWKR